MTRADFGFRNMRASVVKIVWILVALFIMYIFNWHGLAKDRVGEIWAAIIALGCLFFLLYFLNLIAAASQLYGEAEAEISGLRTQLDDSEGRQAALNELWRLRSAGIRLRNQPVGTDDDFEQWKAEMEAWRSEVLEKAEVISINLRNWLERLDRVSPPPKPSAPFHNGEHGTIYRNNSEVLLRMQLFLERDLRWPSANT